MKIKQLDENHSFNPNVCLMLDCHAYKAILLKELAGWCKINYDKRHNQKLGYSWSWMTAKAFSEKFPYMKSRSIARWLEQLEDENWIASTYKFNKFGYDKTKWYTVNYSKYNNAILGIVENGSKWKRDVIKAIEHSGKSDSHDGKSDSHDGESTCHDGEPIPPTTTPTTTPTTKEREKKENSPLENYEVSESLSTLDPVKDKEEEKKEKIPKKRKNVEEAESYHELTQVLDLLKKRTGFAAKIPKTYKTLLRYGAYKLVHSRLKEGHILEDVLSVIDFKCDEWINDPKMSRYLTYDTLLRKSNFEKYLNQYSISKNRKHGKQQTTSHKSGKESLSIEELFKLIDEGGCESGF